MDLYFGITNILAGIIMTLIGFKVYNPFKGKNQPEKEEEWYKKFGTFFKIAGIAVFLFGLFMTFSGIQTFSTTAMKNLIKILAIVFILTGCNHIRKESGKENNVQEKETPYSGKLEKVDSKNYDRYILTKTTTDSFIISMLKEYGEIMTVEDDKYKTYNFGIANYENWKIIKVDSTLNFYSYHNIVGWLSGYDENPEIPEYSIGFAKNIHNAEKNYIFYRDPNWYDDTQIGVFYSNKSFYIYLPSAYEEYGNLMITKDFKISVNETIDFAKRQGIDISKIESLKYFEHKIKMCDLD